MVHRLLERPFKRIKKGLRKISRWCCWLGELLSEPENLKARVPMAEKQEANNQLGALSAQYSIKFQLKREIMQQSLSRLWPGPYMKCQDTLVNLQTV